MIFKRKCKKCCNNPCICKELSLIFGCVPSKIRCGQYAWWFRVKWRIMQWLKIDPLSRYVRAAKRGKQ